MTVDGTEFVKSSRASGGVVAVAWCRDVRRRDSDVETTALARMVLYLRTRVARDGDGRMVLRGIWLGKAARIYARWMDYITLQAVALFLSKGPAASERRPGHSVIPDRDWTLSAAG